jgi:hypothetical protein
MMLARVASSALAFAVAGSFMRAPLGALRFDTLGQVLFLAGVPLAICQPLFERLAERSLRPRACPTSS